MSLSHTGKFKLIDIVESYPDLWRVTRKAPNLKQKLWNDVGAEIGTSGIDARRQWEILRDQFRREYKRYTCDKSYKSKWVLYDRMFFVSHALRQRYGIMGQSNSDNEEQDPEEKTPLHSVEQKWMLQSELDDLPKIQVRQDLHGSTDSSPSETTTYMLTKEEPSTSAGVSSPSQHPRYCEMDYSSTRRKRRRHVENTEDEDYHFVMSILPSLRSIQHTKKLRIRSKIMELIATELDTDFEDDNQLLSLHLEPKTESDVEDKFRPDILP